MNKMTICELFQNIYNDTWWPYTLVPKKFKFKRTIYYMTSDNGAFTGYEDNKGRNFLDKINVIDCLQGNIEILERL